MSGAVRAKPNGQVMAMTRTETMLTNGNTNGKSNGVIHPLNGGIVAAGQAPVTAKPDMSATDAMRAELEALKAENARLRAAKPEKAQGELTLKVGSKGAVSVYGLGRFPVTLYGTSWERLAGQMDRILTFVKAQADKGNLRGKDESVEDYCARTGKPLPIASDKS